MEITEIFPTSIKTAMAEPLQRLGFDFHQWWESLKDTRKDIWEALHLEPSPDYRLDSGDDEVEIQVATKYPPEIGYRKPPPQTKAFAAETAALTGESKAQINRNLARAEAVGTEHDRGQTGVDRGVDKKKACPRCPR